MKGILPYNDLVEESFEAEERALQFIKDSMIRNQQLTDQMVRWCVGVHKLFVLWQPY